MIHQPVGLLGGTFDPVHLGHIQLAEAAIQECLLKKVLFIPSASPPHKAGESVLCFHHRAAMVELVSANRSEFECNTVESNLPAPTYTINLLHALGHLYRDLSRFFFIIGSDAFLEILSWKSHWEVLSLVNVIIAIRKGNTRLELENFLLRLGYYQPEAGKWIAPGRNRSIRLLKSQPDEISSSEIRFMVGAGRDVDHYLPDTVSRYIKQHSLYQTATTIEVKTGRPKP